MTASGLRRLGVYLYMTPRTLTCSNAWLNQGRGRIIMLLKAFVISRSSAGLCVALPAIDAETFTDHKRIGLRRSLKHLLVWNCALDHQLSAKSGPEQKQPPIPRPTSTRWLFLSWDSRIALFKEVLYTTLTGAGHCAYKNAAGIGEIWEHPCICSLHVVASIPTLKGGSCLLKSTSTFPRKLDR